MSEVVSSPVSSPASSPLSSALSGGGSSAAGSSASGRARRRSAPVRERLLTRGAQVVAHAARITERARVLEAFAPVGGEFRLSMEEIMEDLEHGRD